MTKTNYSSLICVFLLLTIFSAEPCFSNEKLSVAEKPLGSVTLQLKWKHQFQFAGYYAALEKGFYRKAGLDVKILEVKDGVASTDQVIKGEADFGVAMSDLVLHRAKGQPLVALASIFQHSPLIILTLKASRIENVHSLKRKRIAMEGHSAELLAYFESEGLPLNKIEIFPHEFSVSTLISGKVDAISAYSTDEPFVLLNQGIEYNVFSPRAAGIDFYGDTLFTSKKKVDENPELVSAFLDASLEGWRYALDNTEEIIDLILSKYTRRHSREHLLFEAQMSKKLIMADVVELGYMNAGRWGHIARTYEKLGMIDSDFSLEGFVYAPHSKVDYTWVKWFVGAMAGTILLVGIGALFLLFFNKKLKAEIDERKKTERALKDSEEKYKALFNNAQVALFRNRVSDGKLIEINERYANMAGYSNVGNCMAEFNAADAWADISELYELLEALKENGVVFDYETKIIRRDGTSIWISFSATIFPEHDYIEGSIVDITERKRSEEALRESENKYRIIAENMADIITIMDMNLRFTYVSPSIVRLRGFTVEEALEQTIDQLMTPDSFRLIANAFEEELRLEATATADPDRTRTLELEEYKKDGSTIWVENTSSFIRDKDQKPIGILVVSRDISERRRAKAELEELSSHQKALLSAIPDIVMEVDKHKVYTWANQSGYNFFGDDVIGKEASLYFEGEQKTYEAVQPIFNGEEDVIYLESWQRRKDGEKRLLAWWCKGLKDETGNVLGALSTARDITDQMKMQELLRQNQKMESIGNLAGGIAHDFNNILSAIIGFTELSLDDVKKGSILDDNLQEIYAAGKRAKNLVRQILAFARQSEAEVKPIQLASIVTEAIKFIRSSIPTTIEIKQKVDSTSLIMGNQTQIHQIMMNLFTNAAYAMETNGGILDVSLKDIKIQTNEERNLLDIKNGNYIEIKVSDTGVGIPPDILRLIFEPYFTTKGPGEGTGLGLAVVHGIVESYGGKITADSTLGKGTVFTIYLPITEKGKEYQPYKSETLPTGNEHILLVDDEAPILKMEAQILERLGYSVTTRTSSIEALELFKSKPNAFDLVITDTTMPNMTGDKLSIELMKIRPDIPVIICTGYSKKISDVTASEIGIKAFAYKPIVKADLGKTVRKILDDAKGIAHG